LSWPKLDSRHFSPNSLGRCLSCEGRGLLKNDDEIDSSSEIFEAEACKTCSGTGLLIDLKAILYRGRSIHRLYQSSIRELLLFMSESLASLSKEAAAQRLVVEQLQQHLRRLDSLGLDYLQLGRRILSLSHGEAQRLRLSSILSEQLRGVLYVLDEPSQGLHPREIERINEALRRLRDQGNTVLVVDHDPNIMQASDWIIDLGPDGGRQGGYLLAEFAPKDAGLYQKESLTARYLAETEQPSVLPTPKKFDSYITLFDAHLYNLKIKKARIPLQALTVVTGVSGAGKSSLVLKTLYRNLEQHLKGSGKKAAIACAKMEGVDSVTACTLISRKPIAKSSVSMPATWLDIFTELRQLFASVPEAQIFGLDAGSFSLSHDEGRCPECKGRGVLVLTMKFLADAEVPCPICEGKRYKSQVLEVRYGGLNLAEVLELSIAEALEIFKNHRLIHRRLLPAVHLGLGYLKLGQPSSSLSGGESQRLKLVPYLAKKVLPGTVLFMDEPTAGLHFRDVKLLLEQLHALVAQGTTLIIVEHDRQLIDAADWILELGPGAGENGGQLLYEGPPTCHAQQA
jgi:excinuclease ABC subunit A